MNDINNSRNDNYHEGLDYPQHVESFETYYYLGELRTLKATAEIRFRTLFPDCHPDSPEYKSKFSSFYTKIKRWAKKERWDEWVKRKEIEERSKREAEMRQRLESFQRTLRGYQALTRQAILAFSDKVRNTLALKRAVETGNEAEALRLKQLPRVEIKNFKELREMIELDLMITRTLEQQPEMSPEEERLAHSEMEKIDTIMERIRKAAMDSGES